MADPLIEVGHAGKPYAGETETGDRCVVRRFGDRALVGAIDGLGHGPEAAQAAAAAVAVLEHFFDEPLDSLMRRCHERLAETRGAAVTLALLDPRNRLLKWVGAGNVVGVLCHTEPSGMIRYREFFVRGGVVGASLPSLEVAAMPLARGDIIVLATDGLRPSFVEGIDRFESPQRLAERLLDEYWTGRDDALVVVTCLRGGAA